MPQNNKPARPQADELDATALETWGLGRRFGRHWALAHVDLVVRQGEALLVAGPNGSGKTTLVRTVAGLYRPSAGKIEVFGEDPLRERLSCRRRVSLLSHDSYLYDRLTAFETVRLWARLLGRPSGEDRLLPLLEEVGLSKRRNARVGGFSAGMRKRLTLLRVRMENPRLVLLDEPFAALDVAGQRLVENWIEGFRLQGVAVVMASHALRQAARLCDRGLLLKQGQVAWHGSPEEVLQQAERER